MKDNRRLEGATATLLCLLFGLGWLWYATDWTVAVAVFFISLSMTGETQRKSNQILDVVDPE